MMTGDSKRNAQRVADELGIDELHAEVLPEDKAAYVKQAKAGRLYCYDGRGWY